MDSLERGNPSAVVIEGSVSASTVVPAPADGHGGPNRLTEMQEAFVTAYLENGGKAGEAALTAGASHDTYGIRLLAKRKVQDEIARRVKVQHGSALAIGLQGLFKIVEKGVDERAIVAASVALLDRFGLAPPKGPLIDARTVNNISGPAASAVLQLVAERAAARVGKDGEL